MTRIRSRAAITLALGCWLAGCTLARGVSATATDAGRDSGPSPVDAGDLDASDLLDTGAELDAGPDAQVAVDGGLDGGADAGSSTQLDLSRGGSFARATEGSYLTGAPNDGSAPFLRWAPADTRRIENRGDGLGDMLLIEGPRTNAIRDSRDVVAGTWSAGMGATIPNDGRSPDGDVLADRLQVAAGQYSPYHAGSPSVAPAVAVSVYVRRRTGAGPDIAQVSLEDGQPAAAEPIDETWERVSLVHAAADGAMTYLIPAEGRARQGLSARALDYLVDLAQQETGFFPTSVIRTGPTALTRGADQLSYAVGEYPDSFRAAGFRVAFAPDFSSSDLLAEGSGALHFVLAFGDADGLRLENRGGSIVASAVIAGGAGGSVTSAPLTWTRGQLLSFEVRPGSLAVAGFGVATASTPLAWPAAPLVLGGRGGTCFGRFSLTIHGL